MKQTFALIILIWITYYSTAQYGCKLIPGDTCYISAEGAEFRTRPNYGYSILATIGQQITRTKAVIVLPKVINQYAKVKLVSMQGDTTGFGHLINTEAWVKKKYLKFIARFGNHNISDSSIGWNDDIAFAERLRKINSCQYQAGEHARLLLDRARARYREEAYDGAVDDIDRAIDILTYDDNLIIYHWYRAHARSELEDYYGAIDDLDYIIEHKDSLEGGSYDFKLEEVLCWKSQNLYLSGENYKAKTLLNIALASDPENGFAYYLRGQVKYQLEDLEGGCEDLARAAELGFDEAFEALQTKCE